MSKLRLLYMLKGYGRTEVGVQPKLAIHVGFISDTPLSVSIHPVTLIIYIQFHANFWSWVGGETENRAVVRVEPVALGSSSTHRTLAPRALAGTWMR